MPLTLPFAVLIVTSYFVTSVTHGIVINQKNAHCSKGFIDVFVVSAIMKDQVVVIIFYVSVVHIIVTHATNHSLLLVFVMDILVMDVDFMVSVNDILFIYFNEG